MSLRILVPFDLSDPTPVPPALAERFGSAEVVAMGHYPVPEQTPNESASEQFGSEAQQQLDELIHPLTDAGASVTTHLVFGKDSGAAIEEVMDQEHCIAELVPAASVHIDDVLVPVPGVEEFSRLPEFIGLLTDDQPQKVTLFHVVDTDNSREEADELVRDVKDQLIANGLAAECITTRVTEGGAHDDEILRVAPEYDAVIMYESQRRMGDPILGSLSTRIRNTTGDPVIVVRRDY